MIKYVVHYGSIDAGLKTEKIEFSGHDAHLSAKREMSRLRETGKYTLVYLAVYDDAIDLGVTER